VNSTHQTGWRLGPILVADSGRFRSDEASRKPGAGARNPVQSDSSVLQFLTPGEHER
jgi:hypothetical protein